jgi:hypothetical protein
MPRRDSDDDRDDDTPFRNGPDDDSGEYRRPARKRGGLPGWAWALIVVGAVLLVCGGGSVVAVLAYSAKQASGTPKKTPADLHKEWAGRSQYDWIREFGEADRNDFDTGGGTFYYSRGAVSEKTGKPTGVKVRIDGGTVTWVAEWE